MAHLTPKENLLRTLWGEIPEWVPSYSYYGPLPGVDEEPPNMGVRLAPLQGTRGPQGGNDIWGVPYEPVEMVGGFSLPKPGVFILKDIRKWQDVVKVPEELWTLDWKAVAEDAMTKLPYSRDRVSLWYSPTGGYFMQMMGLMGFTEGLCAWFEEPDAVKEMLAYMHKFYLHVCEQVFDVIQPDVLSLADDTASERTPFVSREMYREFLLPLYDDFARFARNRAIPINMHNCGKSGVFFEDLTRIGVSSWEPVQLSNDIKAIQKKMGRQLVIGGGWEGRGRLTEADVTDEEIRESVRVCLDTYARDGGFMFAAAYTPSGLNDERTAHWNAVLQKEVYDYGHTFYK
jgi:hypothetical protein